MWIASGWIITTIGRSFLGETYSTYLGDLAAVKFTNCCVPPAVNELFETLNPALAHVQIDTLVADAR